MGQLCSSMPPWVSGLPFLYSSFIIFLLSSSSRADIMFFLTHCRAWSSHGEFLLFLGLYFLPALVLCILHSWFLFPFGLGEEPEHIYMASLVLLSQILVYQGTTSVFPGTLEVTSRYPAHYIWHQFGFLYESVVWGPSILWFPSIFSSPVPRGHCRDGHGAGREVSWGGRILLN